MYNIIYAYGTSLFGLYAAKVIYALARGTRNIFAIKLLPLTSVWMLCWYLRAFGKNSLSRYFTWAIHV